MFPFSLKVGDISESSTACPEFSEGFDALCGAILKFLKQTPGSDEIAGL
jgi:hypothetical protein